MIDWFYTLLVLTKYQRHVAQLRSQDKQEDPMRFMRVQQAIELIQAEYERTPGLRITVWQAQHLWHLSNELCDRALTALIKTKFLVPAPDGTYVRRAGS